MHFSQSSWVILSKASCASCSISANLKVVFLFTTYRLTWALINSIRLYWQWYGGSRATVCPISFGSWSNSYIFLAVQISSLERSSAVENEILLRSHSMIFALSLIHIFFYVKGVILEEWFPEGTTVNQHYYKDILTKLRERLGESDQNCGKWFRSSSRQCICPRLTVTQFSPKKRINVLEYPPYLLNLAFPKWNETST